MNKQASVETLAFGFHDQPIEDLFEKFSSSTKGLSQKEAQKRQKIYGFNQLSQTKKTPLLVLFLNQFKSPLIYILLFAAIVTAFLEHLLDTYVILGVVFFNAVFGLIHEIKASRAMEALSKVMALKTRVRRDNQIIEIPAIDLVPGDIVELESGMKVPADLRIIEENNLRVDEAILTGESIAQEKRAAVLQEKITVGDRTNMLFGGTYLVSGNAVALTVATGLKTQFGSIAKEINTTEKEKTPLQKKLEGFSKNLLIGVTCIVIIIFALGFIKNLELLQIFLIAISISVSIIPEGLPAIVTITLATGALKMSKRKAIIRKLMAVETLGSTTLIASDKTGTLTKNEMTIEKIYIASEEKIYSFSGSGYEPKGEISPDKTDKLEVMVKYAALCTNAEIFESQEKWQVSGDPTEAAILTALGKIGYLKEDLVEKFPRLDEIPFDTNRGYMAVLLKGKENNIIIVKGKAEKILDFSKINLDQKKAAFQTMELFANSALRVLAVGAKEVPITKTELTEKELTGLDFLGLEGMIDPPRKEVRQAIEDCKDAGIRTVMITGDYSLTAKAIAIDLGIIKDGDPILTGEELESLSGGDFNDALKNVSVFARISPEQKLKIVDGFQKKGEIVAVTGDGINDAPALKKSDVGVAMGQGGTDATREVADLVLANNNFATIVAAVEEGRTVFQNIRRAVLFLLSTSFGELLIILFGLFFLPASYNLPLLPVYILWLNLATDGTAGLGLALEPTHPGALKYKTKSLSETILDKTQLQRVIFISTIMLIGTLFVYLREINISQNLDKARTFAFATMAFFQIFNVLNSRSIKESIFSKGFFRNKYIIGAVLISSSLAFASVYLPVFQKIFRTVPLLLNDWFLILFTASWVIIGVELVKFYIRKNSK